MLIFNYAYAYVSGCGYVPVCFGAHRDQKRLLDTLELEF